MKKPILYVVFGPSGGGKSHLISFLSLVKLVSYTTRLPREGEWNGKDYNFVTKEEFFNLDLIEYAEYYNNYYGIDKNTISNMKEDSVHIMEIQGALKLKELFPEQVILIYLNTTYNVRKERMLNRGETEEFANFRLSNSKKEEENQKFADFIVNNDGNIEETLREFITIIKEERNGQY